MNINIVQFDSGRIARNNSIRFDIFVAYNGVTVNRWGNFHEYYNNILAKICGMVAIEKHKVLVRFAWTLPL